MRENGETLESGWYHAPRGLRRGEDHQEGHQDCEQGRHVIQTGEDGEAGEG